MPTTLSARNRTTRKPNKAAQPAQAQPAYLRLTEDFIGSAPTPKVDREKGIIFGVKVVGLESPNGVAEIPQARSRRYLTEALKAAVGLYEGAQVNLNHETRSGQDRDVEDGFGRLVNVRVEEDGLRADLHYLTTHPMAARIAEAAERMPEQFGLSPHHFVRGELRGDVYVVTEIRAVESVDIVRKPATTRGLFESLNQSAARGNTVKRKIKETLRAIFSKPDQIRLLEDMDPMMPTDAGAEMDVPADDADLTADEHGVEAFAKMVSAAAKEGDWDKVKKIVAMFSKLLSGDTAASTDATEGDDDGNTDDEDKAAKESLQLKAEVASLKREKTVRKLAATAGVNLTEEQIDALALVTDDAKVKLLVESYKPAGRTADRSGGGVRSAASRQTTTTNTDTAADPETLYKSGYERLTGRAAPSTARN